MTENTIIIQPCEECGDTCQCGIVCQSVNHSRCYDYGEDNTTLWQCPNCNLWLCYTDGVADENGELCDSCVADIGTS